MIESLLAIPGAIAVGISLGLLGSGGSVLTVPVLVYLVGQDEKVAIFGVPGMAGTWFGAFLAGWIPGITQLVLFAGSYLAKRIRQDKLKTGFGYFLIAMAAYILIRSVPDAMGFIS